jgi:hypothetical protein
MRVAPRRVPRGDELALLMRCRGYRFSRTGSVKGVAGPPDPADLAAATGAGWPVGVTERWQARDLVERAVELVAVLDSQAVLAAFVAGLGSTPRGRQTIISYGWARFLKAGPPGCRTAASTRCRRST